VTFDEVRQSCNVFAIDGLNVPVISIEKMIRNKLAAARPKDLADVAELQKK
jgi:hypothetical protein